MNIPALSGLSEDAEPRDIRDCNHDDEDDDYNFIAAGVTDAKGFAGTFPAAFGFADPAGRYRIVFRVSDALCHYDHQV